MNVDTGEVRSVKVETMGTLGIPDPDQVKHDRAPVCKRRGWHPFDECGERQWIRDHNRRINASKEPRRG
jgi:hypothetical protein